MTICLYLPVRLPIIPRTAAGISAGSRMILALGASEIFFTSVGMLLDPAFLLSHLGQALSLVALVIIGKGVIFAGITRAFGYTNVVPLAAGLGLSQVGEFSFVLARVGVVTDSISQELYSLTLTVAVITMLLTPVLASLTSPLYSYNFV